MAITTQDIHDAADRIRSEGGKPTLAALRATLGGGSFTTISEAMKVWKDAQQKTAAPIREVAPAAVTDRLIEVGAEMWSIAQGMANDRLASERESLDVARQEMEQAQAEAAELADQLAAELDSAKLRIEKIGEDLNLAAQHAKQQATENEAMARRVGEFNEATHTAQAALAESQKRADELLSLLDQERAARSFAEHTRAAADQQIAVLSIKLETMTADQERMKKEIEDSARSARVSERSSLDLKGKLETTQARLEGAQSEKSEAWKQTKDAQAKALSASSEAAELRGRLSAIEAELKNAIANKTK